MLKRDVKQALKRTVRRVRRKLPQAIKPDWTDLLKSDQATWRKYRENAQNGPLVLIATSTGGHRAVSPIESLLAIALTLRGANVHILLCDRFLPACSQAVNIEFWSQAEFVNHGPKSLCDDCFYAGLAVFEPLELPIHTYNEWVTPEEQSSALNLSCSVPQTEIQNFRLDGLKVGEHALAGALKFFAKGSLDDEPFAEAVLRRYLQASLLTVYAMQNLLQTYPFASSCFNHGIYVPQGLIGEVLRQHNVAVTTWNPAYRKQCFIFSHGDTYHHTLMSEPTSAWENIPWNAALETKLMDYLKSRWYGTQDWIWFHEKPRDDLAAIAQEMGLDLSRPTIGLLTNVIWDAQLHYPANAFPSMLEWIIQTVQYFINRPELQLVIRVHPAEIRGWLPSRQLVADEIRKAFPELPANIIVIPPESQISTYAVMMQCDSVIIYGTKTGVELSSLGIPIIVAGEAWIRNKGITHDAQTAAEYFSILDRLPLQKSLDEATTRRARLYAYHFFFRRMIPLSVMKPVTGWPPYEVQLTQLDELLPGRDPGLDVICDGILQGSDFIYKDEELYRVTDE
ncbi:MAG: capsule biosynthesis protein [Anaerolineae bacterium]|nr:capsule biosynthesis protein [Anaerolineae bacterium]